MKNQKIALTLFGIALGVTSCAQPSSESDLPLPGEDTLLPTPEIPHSPSVSGSAPSSPDSSNDRTWNVTFLSSCSYGSIFFCPGGFGFTVDQIGTFHIGPGPNHQARSGKLEANEFKSLANHISTLKTSSKTGKMTCLASEYLGPISMESITIQFEGDSATLVQIVDSKFCFDGVTPQRASDLYSLLKLLTNKYYPLPFPKI